MADTFPGFTQSAKALSRNPLGIIALFLVLVYGFASLVTMLAPSLHDSERLPLIYFLVVFPVLVLVAFVWLVSQHAGKLYSPGDFKDEHNFVTAVASLAVASARRSDGSEAKIASVEELSRVVREVEEIRPLALSGRQSERECVLWVDDRPENNVYVRQALEAVGIDCTLALSTSQALTLVQHEKFDAIISDMGRKEGPREGYVLLDALRERGIRTPFFVYAGSNLPEHTTEVLQHGGQGNTNNAQELFQMVSKAVFGGRSVRRSH